MFSRMEQVQGRVEVKCETCNSGAMADSFCRQCSFIICNSCSDAHKTMETVFEGHEVVSIHDLKEGKARVNITWKEPCTLLKCPVHNEELKVYCFDCDTLICRDCTVVVDHRDHRFQFSAVAAPEMEEELMKALEPLRQVGDGLSRAVEEVKSTRHEVEAQGVSVAQTINTSFDELHQIVEKRRQELLDEARRRVQEKVETISPQEETLSLASAEVRSVIDCTERYVGHCTDNEVMRMHADIKGLLTQKVEKYNEPVGSMEPVLEVDMGMEVKCAEDLQQLCQSKARIIQLPIDPAKCTVMGEGVKTAKMNQIAEVTLTAKLSSGKPTRRCIAVDGQLKSLSDGSILKCDVDQSGPGEYRIHYTPTVRGRHELSLSIDGHHVAGSPFPVFVSIHPTQLGKPVGVLEDLRLVSAVNMYSSGEIIVGKQDGDVITFFKENSRVRTFGRDMLKLDNYDVVAIAVDNENYMYLTLSSSNAITKINEDGSIVNNTRAKHAAGHLGVAVVGEEVMVCPIPSKGTIMVYDRELKYVRRIVGKGMGQFRAISPDSQGNLYVADWDKERVQVIDHHGSFLQSFNCDNNGVKVLTKPRGICVAGQFVYVCNDGLDNDNHGVYIFTTKGEYVTSFGRKGSKIGEFNTPYSLCINSDGFLYVGESNRVQVF